MHDVNRGRSCHLTHQEGLPSHSITYSYTHAMLATKELPLLMLILTVSEDYIMLYCTILTCLAHPLTQHLPRACMEMGWMSYNKSCMEVYFFPAWRALCIYLIWYGEVSRLMMLKRLFTDGRSKQRAVTRISAISSLHWNTSVDTFYRERCNCWTRPT